MSYQIIPNITFILSVLGILLIILKQVPQATALKNEQTEHVENQQRLLEKGLPAQTISKIKVKLQTLLRRAWNFVLEAKDLKPHAEAGYKMKKIFGGKLPIFKKPTIIVSQLAPEEKTEQYFLDIIKLEPKNLLHYDDLGKFYLDRENIVDAKDIYQYLVNHQPANPDFQARLAYCFYQVKNFIKAADHYKKSVILDSTQPNRYYNLSLSLEAAGRLKESKEALRKALQMDPENPKFQQAVNKDKVSASK